MKIKVNFLIAAFLFTILIVQPIIVTASDIDSTITVVYFYSPTCSSCNSISEFLNNLDNTHSNIILKKYDITNLKNKSLLNKYSEAYKVKNEYVSIVPIIFIKNTYLFGEEEIKNHLTSLALSTDNIETLVINDISEDYSEDAKNFKSIKIIGMLGAGFINGLNPCSMSMILYLLSLLLVKHYNVLRIGISYSAGKFITYILLGTIFINLLSRFDMKNYKYLSKGLILIFVVVLLVLNVSDYFAAKRENYNKIKLQLPKFLRKTNHKFIRKFSNIENKKIILPISFALGVVITFGEFLCTGQIYLATVVTVFHKDQTLSLQAFIYLLVYDIAYIMPLLILAFSIYKGKKVFDVSEVIRAKLHYIKLTNIIIFVIYGLVAIFFL